MFSNKTRGSNMFKPSVLTWTTTTALAGLMLLLGACNKGADTPSRRCNRANQRYDSCHRSDSCSL